MSIRFRKTINLGGGLKLNLNKKSAGLSFGGKGARFSVNSDGRKTTSIGIPGTGIYWTKSAEGKSSLTFWNIITLILLMPFVIIYWILQLVFWPFKKLFKSLKKNKVLKIFFSLVIILIIICFGLLFIDKIKITNGDEIRYISLNSDVIRDEDNIQTCYDDGVIYDYNKDISITSFEYKKVLFLYFHTIKFEDGNICELEYYIDEEEILNIINNGEIVNNEDNVDLKNLIKDKKAIVGNKKYIPLDWDKDTNLILYKIDGEYKEIIIFYIDNLLVIEIGLPDEGPKYIAYE